MAVISLFKCAKTKVRVRMRLSEEIEVDVGVHQGSVLSTLFAIVIDVVMNKIWRVCYKKYCMRMM